MEQSSERCPNCGFPRIGGTCGCESRRSGYGFTAVIIVAVAAGAIFVFSRSDAAPSQTDHSEISEPAPSQRRRTTQSLKNGDAEFNTDDSAGMDKAIMSREDVYDQAVKAVVKIELLNDAGNPISLGSGFAVAPDGDIVTNWHVLKGGSSFRLRTHAGKVGVSSQILAFDAERDLALIDVSHLQLGLEPLAVATNKPRISSACIAIGAPHGYEFTSTVGSVSQIRELENIQNIQTDTKIEHGSSGGPLLNLKCEVIGINTRRHITENFAVSSVEIEKAFPIIDRRRQILLDRVDARPHLTEQPVRRRSIKQEPPSTPVADIKVSEQELIVTKAIARLNGADYSGAISTINEFLKDEPDFAFGYYIRAKSKIQLKDLSGALRDCDYAIDLDPTQDSYSSLRRQVVQLKSGSPSKPSRVEPRKAEAPQKPALNKTPGTTRRQVVPPSER